MFYKYPHNIFGMIWRACIEFHELSNNNQSQPNLFKSMMVYNKLDSTCYPGIYHHPVIEFEFPQQEHIWVISETASVP